MKKMCRILACVGTLFLTACTASNNRSTQITPASVTEQKKETPEPKETVSPEVMEALHAYNKLLDNIDAYNFGMGDEVVGGVNYRIVYLNQEIPQLLVTKHYDGPLIAMSKIFGYDSKTQTCIASDAIFQTDSPSQKEASTSETVGHFVLLKNHKGLVYVDKNRSTHKIVSIKLLEWQDQELVETEISEVELNSLSKEDKLIMYSIENRKALE
ncbi:hypothetical protein [Solobacterium moorei]|uniref:hypothetical protein n=1 Tax=Solobacterium moorei TaxID=102148 RepID=UPI0023F140CC|nr:hypothetical protein [Solobacterium moorei]